MSQARKWLQLGTCRLESCFTKAHGDNRYPLCVCILVKDRGYLKLTLCKIGDSAGSCKPMQLCVKHNDAGYHFTNSHQASFTLYCIEHCPKTAAMKRKLKHAYHIYMNQGLIQSSLPSRTTRQAPTNLSLSPSWEADFVGYCSLDLSDWRGSWSGSLS